MNTQCCKKPRITNSDYKRYADWVSTQFVLVTNRHCMSCGLHQHDGKRYTRAEWDAHLVGECVHDWEKVAGLYWVCLKCRATR